MPCLEISMPKTSGETREKLAAQLTDIFAAETPFGAEIFGIRFMEYSPSEAASGGRLFTGGESRPYLHFLFYGPRIGRLVKQKLVAGWTAAFTECVGNSNWRPVIHICEHPYDNVGVEGQLLSEAYEQCAKSNFYYSLSDD